MSSFLISTLLLLLLRDNASVEAVLALPQAQNCTAVQFALSRAGAQLTECMGRAARPFTVCTHCMDQFSHYQRLHDQLNSDGSASCREYLLQLDTVQVLARTREFVVSVWSSGRCADCFDQSGSLNHSQSSWPYRPALQRFFDQTQELQACFANYSRFPLPDNSSLLANESQLVCDKCSRLYARLNAEFMSLSDGHGPLSEQLICMDALDAMNATHRLWSEGFGCDQRARSLQPLPLILAAYLTVVLFYIGARSKGEIKARKLQRQKRLSSFVGSASINSSATPAGDI